jgi:hypothetical protein
MRWRSTRQSTFYRKYRRMDPVTKERIRRMVDVWDDDEK